MGKGLSGMWFECSSLCANNWMQLPWQISPIAWRSLVCHQRSFPGKRKFSWWLLNTTCCVILIILPSLPCFSYFCTGERCLSHETDMSALYSVNPSAQWIIKPRDCPDLHWLTHWLTDLLSHSHTSHYFLQTLEKVSSGLVQEIVIIIQQLSLSLSISFITYLLFMHLCLEYYFMQCVLSKALFRQTKANSLT